MAVDYKYELLDVSKHQGDIKWNEVFATNRFQGVIIRAGYGKLASQEDIKFKKNITEAYAAGFRNIGVYWYSYAGDIASGKLEAEACLKVISPYKDKINLPVFFDQEYETAIKNASKEVRTTIVKNFCDAVRNAGYRPGFYASKDWMTNYVTMSQIGSDVIKWVAQYSSSCTYTGGFSMWQYSSKGTVDGISGNIDMNKATEGIMPKIVVEDNSSKSDSEDEGSTVTIKRWKNVNNKWYHFSVDGKMDTGWKKISGNLYYFLTKEDAEKYNLPEGVCFSMDTSHAVIQ